MREVVAGRAVCGVIALALACVSCGRVGYEPVSLMDGGGTDARVGTGDGATCIGYTSCASAADCALGAACVRSVCLASCDSSPCSCGACGVINDMENLCVPTCRAATDVCPPLWVCIFGFCVGGE